MAYILVCMTYTFMYAILFNVCHTVWFTGNVVCPQHSVAAAAYCRVYDHAFLLYDHTYCIVWHTSCYVWRALLCMPAYIIMYGPYNHVCMTSIIFCMTCRILYAAYSHMVWPYNRTVLPYRPIQYGHPIITWAYIVCVWHPYIMYAILYTAIHFLYDHPIYCMPAY